MQRDLLACDAQLCILCAWHACSLGSGHTIAGQGKMLSIRQAAASNPPLPCTILAGREIKRGGSGHTCSNTTRMGIALIVPLQQPLQHKQLGNRMCE